MTRLPILALLAALLLLAGCGTRLSDEQAANLSQGREDLRAAAQMLPQAQAGTLPWDQVGELFTAGWNRVEAASANADLPPADHTAAELVASPPVAHAEAAAASAAKNDPPQGWGAGAWAAVLGGAGVAFAIARKIAPLVPGVGPIWSTVGDVAWGLWQHADARDADKAQAQAAQLVGDLAPLALLVRSDQSLAAKLPNSALVAISALYPAPRPLPPMPPVSQPAPSPLPSEIAALIPPTA